jgi:hypothetical protein
MAIFLGSCKFKRQAEYIKQLESTVKEDSLKRIAEMEALKAEMQAKIDSIKSACNSFSGSGASGNYCVITGSFKEQQNATNYLKEMVNMGYKASIINSGNGFYLVSTFCGNSLNEALSALNIARSNIHPDSWIFIK